MATQEIATTQPATQEIDGEQDLHNKQSHIDANEKNLICTLICSFNGEDNLLPPFKIYKNSYNFDHSIKNEWYFGRKNCDLTFGSGRISGKHFRIWCPKEQINKENIEYPTLLIEDLSTNGTYVNNIRLQKNKSSLLVNGDEIGVGIGVKAHEVRFLVHITSFQNYISDEQQGIFEYYDFRESVGKGAFAVVWKAVERSTGKSFAVKAINKKKTSMQKAISREIEILRSLSHPNIAGLHDTFENDTSVYLIMEYVSGGDLMDYVIDKGAIQEESASDITRQILEGISYAHSLGISHRDLKPDNILISQTNPLQVKITDFGLGKIAGPGSELKTFCGTLAYLAPEIITYKSSSNSINSNDKNSNRSYSNLVDIWSIGCLTYVIVTASMPFNGNTQEDLYKSILNADYNKESISSISLFAASFVDSLLQSNPSRRPSALQALNHPWITRDFEDSTQSFSQLNDQVMGEDGNVIDVNLDKDSLLKVQTKSDVWTVPKIPNGNKNIFKEDSYHSEHDDDSEVEAINFECSQRVSQEVMMENKRALGRNIGEVEKNKKINLKDIREENPKVKNIKCNSYPSNDEEEEYSEGENSYYKNSNEYRESMFSSPPGFKNTLSTDTLAKVKAIRPEDKKILKNIEDRLPLTQIYGLNSVRDIDEQRDLITDSLNTWMTLETNPDSIPYEYLRLKGDKKETYVGRLNSCDIIIDDTRVSRIHCIIIKGSKLLEKKKAILFVKSANGCFVNGNLIRKDQEVILNDGDNLVIFKDDKGFLGFKVIFNNMKSTYLHDIKEKKVDNTIFKRAGIHESAKENENNVDENNEFFNLKKKRKI